MSLGNLQRVFKNGSTIRMFRIPISSPCYSISDACALDDYSKTSGQLASKITVRLDPTSQLRAIKTKRLYGLQCSTVLTFKHKTPS